MIENEYVWHALSEIDTNALFFIDTEGVIRNINKGVTTLFGYSAYEIIGRTVEFLMPTDVRKLHESLFSNYVRLRKERQHKSKFVGTQRIFPATSELERLGADYARGIILADQCRWRL